METMETIFTRRSIREYTSQAIPDELVQELLAAAMQAPRPGNQQPWHFIFVAERNQLNVLADVLPLEKCSKPPHSLLLYAQTWSWKSTRAFGCRTIRPLHQNLLLAAHAFRVGSGIGRRLPGQRERGEFKASLGLPEQVIPMCVVPIGYSAAKPELPARRYETRPDYTITTGRVRSE